ncbi:hypothetical protein G7092_10930 [Mucilaginibacter sp. HC2]|uniref:hypothetical protein n=1 Tax=Mucilaginibacter inviolabilis TaxID=2714892 RepID=UPI00140DE7FC|nr:hypothetical protein [Mucilaginibacter inviolabilis]NHA04314.1 hypothetical protein [Mucilaginibacter inviolabilis]
MVKTLWLTVILLIAGISAFGQLHDKDIRQKVLRKGIIGKEYKFVHHDKTVSYLKYLGKAKTHDGSGYKILTSIWLWGLAHRATSRLLIYNGANQYIGQYYLGTAYDLPNSLVNNQLVFLNSNNFDSGCDIKMITRVDLSNGLPKDLFINCKGNRGDLYSFSKNDD